MKKYTKFVKCIDNLGYPFIRIGDILESTRENNDYYWVIFSAKTMRVPKSKFQDEESSQ